MFSSLRSRRRAEASARQPAARGADIAPSSWDEVRDTAESAQFAAEEVHQVIGHRRPHPILLGPGEGTSYEARGSKMTFKAVASAAGGYFSLMERTLPPGGRLPPPHCHLAYDEAYYVLQGEVTFFFAAEKRLGSRGWWALVSGGVSLTFGNTSAEHAVLLVLHAPPLDRYFAELHELWNRGKPPDTAEELELMRHHGMEPG